MELRDVAEQILFAPSLEEKLSCPAVVTDLHPGPALTTPDAPGRPPELRFKDASSAPARFPGLHQLDQPGERGRLLHFFANHELLAVELMALVLLRFPDAPPAFRRGVLKTLQDEQQHTRLYLERMQACGVTFGELPVSGFFWRSVSGMDSPVDYVARLSLTFEQANLDFARHFALGFRQVGDLETGTLLDRIYRDEIAHVAYGLKWFRRWKEPGQSDWDAFCRHLRFPLSPQRAKGFTVNVEGRLAAGFDPEFIARLEVFSQSKGRTPIVHLFNPFAEGFIASGPAFTPAKHQAALARDLAHLPIFLGRQDDVVLTPRRPRIEFLASLKHAGFSLPEFVALDDPAALDALSRRKLGGFRPWARSPDSDRLFSRLQSAVTADPSAGALPFSPALAELYSKAWSARFLREFLERHPSPWLSSLHEIGVAVSSPEAAFDAIDRIRARGHHRVILKEALGLAGSNAIRLWEPRILETQRRWIARRLEKGHPLVVEPWLERAFDFSIQLERRPTGLELVGYTTLVTDTRGQFLANAAGPDHRFRPPARLFELLRHPFRREDLPGEFHRCVDELIQALEPHLASASFIGPLGIDAFIHRTADGTCRLKPVVEINPRYTMGRLTLELMRNVQPGGFGLFRLVNRQVLRAEGFEDFAAFADNLTKRHPVSLAGTPVPRLHEGAICLSDPVATEVCLAVFHVTRSASGLPSLKEVVQDPVRL